VRVAAERSSLVESSAPLRRKLPKWPPLCSRAVPQAAALEPLGARAGAGGDLPEPLARRLALSMCEQLQRLP